MTNRSLFELLYDENEYINSIAKVDKELEKNQQEIKYIYENQAYDDGTPYNKIDLERVESRMKEKMAKRNSLVASVNNIRRDISNYLYSLADEYPPEIKGRDD